MISHTSVVWGEARGARWIAAVVQGVCGLYMVHIDLCGPAYGTFCRNHGREVTLEPW